LPVYKYCTVNNLRFGLFHGMEEVVGSIPTRSTKNSPDFQSTMAFSIFAAGWWHLAAIFPEAFASFDFFGTF
jgi:hypothetical protein